MTRTSAYRPHRLLFMELFPLVPVYMWLENLTLAPVLTMCGSFAEAQAPGTPPGPSCPLIWVRRAVPPYASLTVSCSACSSIRDSSGSGFNPHKQPASSPLALSLLRHLLVWRTMQRIVGLYWQQQRFGYHLGELELIVLFFVFDAFLRGWIVHLFFFGSFFYQSKEMLLHYMVPAHYLHALYEQISSSCCCSLFEANTFEHWWRRSKLPILYNS